MMTSRVIEAAKNHKAGLKNSDGNLEKPGSKFETFDIGHKMIDMFEEKKRDKHMQRFKGHGRCYRQDQKLPGLCHGLRREHRKSPVITAEQKRQILEAAMAAPSAGNQQLYTILDITDDALKQKLSVTCDNQPFIAQGKMVLIFCADFQKWYDVFIEGGCAPRKPGAGDLMLAQFGIFQGDDTFGGTLFTIFQRGTVTGCDIRTGRKIRGI